MKDGNNSGLTPKKPSGELQGTSAPNGQQHTGSSAVEPSTRPRSQSMDNLQPLYNSLGVQQPSTPQGNRPTKIPGTPKKLPTLKQLKLASPFTSSVRIPIEVSSVIKKEADQIDFLEHASTIMKNSVGKSAFDDEVTYDSKVVNKIATTFFQACEKFGGTDPKTVDVIKTKMVGFLKENNTLVIPEQKNKIIAADVQRITINMQKFLESVPQREKARDTKKTFEEDLNGLATKGFNLASYASVTEEVLKKTPTDEWQKKADDFIARNGKEKTLMETAELLVAVKEKDPEKFTHTLGTILGLYNLVAKEVRKNPEKTAQLNTEKSNTIKIFDEVFGFSTEAVLYEANEQRQLKTSSSQSSSGRTTPEEQRSSSPVKKESNSPSSGKGSSFEEDGRLTPELNDFWYGKPVKDPAPTLQTPVKTDAPTPAALTIKAAKDKLPNVNGLLVVNPKSQEKNETPGKGSSVTTEKMASKQSSAIAPVDTLQKTKEEPKTWEKLQADVADKRALDAANKAQAEKELKAQKRAEIEAKLEAKKAELAKLEARKAEIEAIQAERAARKNAEARVEQPPTLSPSTPSPKPSRTPSPKEATSEQNAPSNANKNFKDHLNGVDASFEEFFQGNEDIKNEFTIAQEKQNPPRTTAKNVYSLTVEDLDESLKLIQQDEEAAKVKYQVAETFSASGSLISTPESTPGNSPTAERKSELELEQKEKYSDISSETGDNVQWANRISDSLVSTEPSPVTTPVIPRKLSDVSSREERFNELAKATKKLYSDTPNATPGIDDLLYTKQSPSKETKGSWVIEKELESAKRVFSTYPPEEQAKYLGRSVENLPKNEARLQRSVERAVHQWANIDFGDSTYVSKESLKVEWSADKQTVIKDGRSDEVKRRYGPPMIPGTDTYAAFAKERAVAKKGPSLKDHVAAKLLKQSKITTTVLAEQSNAVTVENTSKLSKEKEEGSTKKQSASQPDPLTKINPDEAFSRLTKEWGEFLETPEGAFLKPVPQLVSKGDPNKPLTDEDRQAASKQIADYNQAKRLHKENLLLKTPEIMAFYSTSSYKHLLPDDEQFKEDLAKEQLQRSAGLTEKMLPSQLAMIFVPHSFMQMDKMLTGTQNERQRVLDGQINNTAPKYGYSKNDATKVVETVEKHYPILLGEDLFAGLKAGKSLHTQASELLQRYQEIVKSPIIAINFAEKPEKLDGLKAALERQGERLKESPVEPVLSEKQRSNGGMEAVPANNEKPAASGGLFQRLKDNYATWRKQLEDRPAAIEAKLHPKEEEGQNQNKKAYTPFTARVAVVNEQRQTRWADLFPSKKISENQRGNSGERCL